MPFSPYGPRHARTYLRAYTDSEGLDQPLLSANRIIGYYRMYKRWAKARMILCACAGWSASVQSTHAWRHLPAWRGSYNLGKKGGYWRYAKRKNQDPYSCVSLDMVLTRFRVGISSPGLCPWRAYVITQSLASASVSALTQCLSFQRCA